MSPHWNPPILPSLDGGRGRKKEKSEWVSWVVHELWVGGVHFGLHGFGGCIGLSPGGIALALADGGAGFGRDWDSRGDFMAQEIYR